MADGNTNQNQVPPKEGQQAETPGGISEEKEPVTDMQPVTGEMLTAYSEKKKAEADKKKQQAENDISVLAKITLE